MNNTVSISDLFQKRMFQVPDYQRGYSWENRHVREFLEDLEFMDQNHRLHYTGTVVLYEPDSSIQRMDEDGNTYATFDIVDGQQRLTTITLLLDGIRRSLTGLPDASSQTLARGIEKNYIKANELSGGDPLFKLTLNKDVDGFFKSSVLSDDSGVAGPSIMSHRRLEAAKAQIANYLKSKIGEEGKEWLRNLYSKVITQLQFTLYQVEQEAEVGVIFEVMNDRGKPLTDLEKVKNYLLYASTYLEGMPNELAQRINSTWADILRWLMASGLTASADEDQLLRVHWLAYYDPNSRDWKGSRSVKERFDLREYRGRYPDMLLKLTDYANGIRESCVSFCDASKPARPNSFQTFGEKPKVRREVVEWSLKLVRMGRTATFLPILIAARKRWANDPGKYLEILKLCEKFAFRVYSLSGYRADAGQAAMLRLAYGIANNSMSFNGATQRLKGRLNAMCGLRSFQSLMSAESELIGDAYNWGGLRYFLYEYEIHLSANNGASPKVAWGDLPRELKNTIEHILPQSITGQRYWESRFSHGEHQRCAHDLGNLTLTKQNSSLSNKPFPEKKGEVGLDKSCYANSPLYAERELGAWEDWTPASIRERREKLLEWARIRWAVD